MRASMMRLNQPRWLRFQCLLIILLISMPLLGFINPANTTDTNPVPSKTFAIIKLPPPLYQSTTSVEAALYKRRSIREYRNEPISLQDVAQLLWAASGITSSKGGRTAPSAGALYPLEFYIVVGNVRGLTAGVYHYLPKQHALQLLADGDKRELLSIDALYQPSVKNAAMDIVITGIYARTMKKYGSRGQIFVHIEVGHAAQNICLQAVSLGLGVVTIGGYQDLATKLTLKLPKDEEPLYIIAIGKPLAN